MYLNSSEPHYAAVKLYWYPLGLPSMRVDPYHPISLGSIDSGWSEDLLFSGKEMTF